VTPQATIADLAVSTSEVNVERLRAFVSLDPRTGVAVLPAPLRPEDANVVGQAELAAVLESARSAYDAVVVDTGPLFDGAMLAALDHTDRLLLICNPEVTSLKNVRIGLETIERLGFDRGRVSLVANRIGAAGAVSRADIEKALETEVAFELPDDPAVPVSVNRALPVVFGDEHSPFARALVAMTPSLFDVPRSPAPAPRERRFILRGRR
jgi:pilus assembly protein CpaE